MPNLKLIKRRIKSAKNISKITKTMKMVAVAKVQKAKRLEAAHQRFVAELRGVLADLQKTQDPAATLEPHPLMTTPAVCRKQLVILITSDRGLCGSYNSSVLKDFSARQLRDAQAGIETTVLCVGKKSWLAARKAKLDIHSSLTPLPANPSSVMARQIAQAATEAFLSKKVDRVLLCYNQFISMVRQQRVCETLVPISADDLLPKDNTKTTETLVEMEPSAEEILAGVLPYYLQSQVYYALLSANAAEHAARMLAMSSATDNASEMIRSLNLVYNKARQAAITKEILEIVGGAKALQKN